MKRFVAAAACAVGLLGPAGAAAASTPPHTAPVLSPAPRDALRAFADAMNDPSLEREDVFAPSSPAHTYYSGYATLRAYGDPQLYTSEAEYRVVSDGLVDDLSGTQFLDVMVDEEGRVADATRNRIPLSASVYAVDVEHASGDVRATIHSVRYANSVLQIVTVVENGSESEAFVFVDSVFAGGQEVTNDYASIAAPGETVARMDVFADLPDTGGTAHARIVIGDVVAADGEFEFELPAMGSPQLNA